MALLLVALLSVDTPIRLLANTGGQTPAPQPGPPLDEDTEALNAEVEAKLREAYLSLVDQAKALQGERTVAGIAIADGTVIFAILTRNLFALQLSVHLKRLQQFAGYSRDQKIEHIRQLQALAERIEYWWRVRAFLQSVQQTGNIDQGRRFLREQADQTSDQTNKAALLDLADRPDVWWEGPTSQIHALIDVDPVVAASEDFLNRLWSGNLAEDLLPFYDDAVASETADAQGELNRVTGLNTVDGMLEFMGPQYARTRQAASGLVGRYSNNFYGPFEDFARSIAEVRGLQRDPLGLNTPLVIGGLLLLSLVVPANMPVLFAVLAAADVATAGYGLYHDVPFLVELSAAADNANRGRAVLGRDAAAQLTQQQRMAALGVLLNTLGVAMSGRALTRSAAEAQAAEMLRRAQLRAEQARAAFRLANPGMAGLAAVQRGVKKAIELGLPEARANGLLKMARTTTPEGVMAASWLTVISKLDDAIAAARKAGVPQAEIDGLIQAALKQNELGLAQTLPTALSRATLERMGVTIVVDHPAQKTVTRFNQQTGRTEPTVIDDYPWDVYMGTWQNQPFTRTIRADVGSILYLRGKLDEMRGGIPVVWSFAEISSLQKMLRQPGLSSMYVFDTFEEVLVKVIDDDLLEFASQFLVHPNRNAIARGQFRLPPIGLPPSLQPPTAATTGATSAAAASAPSGWLPRSIVPGMTANELLVRLGRVGMTLDEDRDPFEARTATIDLEQQALNRAQSRFNTPTTGWSMTTSPDGSIAVTSPDRRRRVTVWESTDSQGRTRVDSKIESIDGDLLETETNTGFRTGSSARIDGSVLPAVEGPTRPARTPSAAPLAPNVPGSIGPPAASALTTSTVPPADTTVPTNPTSRIPTTPAVPYVMNAMLNPAYVRTGSVAPGFQLIVATADGVVIIVLPLQPVAPAAGLDRLFSWPHLASLERVRASRTSAPPWALSPLRPSARAASNARTSSSREQSAPSGLTVTLTSTGNSAGDAFEMTVVNEGGSPVRLDSESFVLEPMAPGVRAPVTRTPPARPGTGRLTTTIKGYCLEFLKSPPTAGMVFRIASDAVQKRFADSGRIFAASRALSAAGGLAPPPGDPSGATEYHDAIRQWAIWTREQSFDERGYARAFVEHSKKNVESRGARWTQAIERAVTALAPARWQAIQQVLREAGVAAR